VSAGRTSSFWQDETIMATNKSDKMVGINFFIGSFLMYFFVCFEDVRFWARIKFLTPMLSASAHRSQCPQGGPPLFGKMKRLWPRIKVTRWLGLTFSLVIF
jgi:hypothetical protein